MERGDACSREELRERMRTERNEMEDMSLTGSQAYRTFHVDPSSVAVFRDLQRPFATPEGLTCLRLFGPVKA